MKKALNAANPYRYVTRKQKIKIFVQVELKKFKENIPKLFGIGIILTYLVISLYEHVNYPIFIDTEQSEVRRGGVFEPTELSITGLPIVMLSEDGEK